MTVAILVVSLLCLALLVYSVVLNPYATNVLQEDHYQRRDTEPLKEISNQTFANQTVSVDGKHFIGCTFRNVTFYYEGGRFLFDPSCAVISPGGKLKLQTTSSAVRGAVQLLNTPTEELH